MRKHGITRATYFNWRSKYAGTGVAEFERLKVLEAENVKLKRMYAVLALENAAIEDVLTLILHAGPASSFHRRSGADHVSILCRGGRLHACDGPLEVVASLGDRDSNAIAIYKGRLGIDRPQPILCHVLSLSAGLRTR